MRYLSIFRKSDQRGFSLIELMMGMIVFSIGVLALTKMQVSSIQGNAFSRSSTEAMTVAQDRLEQLASLTYSSFEVANELQDQQISGEDGFGTDGLSNTGGDADFSASQGEYDIFWNIADNANGTMKNIEVIVTWRYVLGEKAVSLRAVRAKKD